jgi:hypothetical protein
MGMLHNGNDKGGWECYIMGLDIMGMDIMGMTWIGNVS